MTASPLFGRGLGEASFPAMPIKVIRHHLAGAYLSVLVNLPVDDAAVTSAACAVAGKHFGHLLLGKLGAEPSGEVVLVGAGLVTEGGHSGQIIPNSPSVYRGGVR